MNYFLFVLSSLLVLESNAFDPFVGIFEQGDQPCFETVKSENCDTPIHEVFTPKYKGSDTNTPNTKFYLFTSKNKERAELLHNCGGKLPKNTSFNSTEETVFVSHGIFESVCRVGFQREFKEQLFVRGGYNVILVDWTWGNFADTGGIINSFVAGEEVGFVIKNIMMQNNYADGSKFHIIGHSAGAYVAIMAGKFIREWSAAHKLRRITLLDPGVFIYRNDDFAHNTTYKEAHFVDVLHSNAGTCFGTSISGSLRPLGHADFFPNGGVVQLPCYNYGIEAILKGDLITGLIALGSPEFCFHLQALEYFKISITHPGGLHIGVECDSYEDFLSGKCTRCCKKNRMNCAVAGMDSEHYFPHLGEPWKARKYYYNLGLLCPYNEDYNIINKDC